MIIYVHLRLQQKTKTKVNKQNYECIHMICIKLSFIVQNYFPIEVSEKSLFFLADIFKLVSDKFDVENSICKKKLTKNMLKKLTFECKWIKKNNNLNSNCNLLKNILYSSVNKL